MDGQEQDQDQEQGPGRRAALLYLTITGAAEVAYLAYQVWLIMPDHQRQNLRMRAADKIRQLAGAGARRAAAASAETELRTGLQLYQVPRWLSQLRDAAAAYYNREKL